MPENIGEGCVFVVTVHGALQLAARYLTCAGYGHIVGQRECKDYQFHVAFHYFHVKMRLHPRKYGVFDDSGTK